MAPVEDFTNLTLEIIARCGFGYPLELFDRTEPHPFVEALGAALLESGRRVMRPKLLKPFACAAERKFRTDIATLYEVVDSILDDRLARRKAGDTTDHPDLLQLMLSAVGTEGEPILPRENIRHQLLTFLVAGHETTSGLLSFAVALLAAHPQTIARAREEVATVLAGRPVEEIAFADVLKLRYVQAVLNETLRLWPTASTLSVTALQDVRLGGKYALKKDDRLVVSLWLLHRDKAAWGDDAELFRPERFLGGSDAVLKHAFKPFGNASRSCIGKFFALHEAALALAVVLTRFDLENVEGYPFKIKQQLTIKPDGLRVRVRPKA